MISVFYRFGFGFLILWSVLVAQAVRPNVLFIAVDDLNDWLGCMNGHPDARTPNMDRLAARGTLFLNAHCQAPICGPSRGSLLSGLYPHRTGFYQQPQKKGLFDDVRFAPESLLPVAFKRGGYHTMGGGKITHGMDMKKVFQELGPEKSFGPYPKGRKRLNYSPDTSIPYTGTLTDWGAFPDRDEMMPDYKIAQWGVEKLMDDYDRPFFLAIGFMRPHVPFTVPQKWFDLFDEEQLILPKVPMDDLEDVPKAGRALHDMPRYPTIAWLNANNRKQFRKCVHGYLASIAFVDAQIGKVLDALDASPHKDNTMVVLFGDHGYHLGEKHRVCKHGLWEESTKVPLIVVAPGKPSGTVCSKPVGLIDLYPTLLELADLPARSENQGRSMVPLLIDPDAVWREAILTTYGKGNHALRGERYRYIRYSEGSEELYDHKTDPNEWANLAAQPEKKAILDHFRGLLPVDNAPHHPTTSTSPVNAWFESVFKRHNL